MKLTISFLLSALMSVFACACQGEEIPTQDLPEIQPASEQGKVEVLWYDSKDYTSVSKSATRKPAYVYLPYGYDASKK